MNIAICNRGSNANCTVLDPKTTTKKYRDARIIILDDDFNIFEHVVNCLETIHPRMSREKSLKLSFPVDNEGSLELYRCSLEQKGFYL